MRSAGAWTLHTPFGTCITTGAAFECVCPPAPRQALSASLLSAALAAEAPSTGELFVEEGMVILRTGDRDLRVSAGQLVRIQSDRTLRCEALEAAVAGARLAWRDGRDPWQESRTGDLEGWVPTGAGQVQVVEGALRLTSRGAVSQRLQRAIPPVERFEWSATVRRVEGGYLEVLLPGARVLTLGELPQLGDGREHVLTVRWDATPALLLDGVRLKGIRSRGEPSGSLGLGVTHGTLDLMRWRWRRLP